MGATVRTAALSSGGGPSCRDAALEYALRGWRVLPVWWPINGRCACGKSDCDKPGKHPIGTLVPHGVKDASSNATVIDEWFSRQPDANVAIATGETSGFDVLDVDGEEGKATLEALVRAHAPLPTTPQALTGSGGVHELFAHRAGLRNAVKFAPGLDVRTTGGYIVAAPSLHVSGRRYVWEVEHDPFEIPCADWPGWLHAAAAASRSVRDTATTEPSGDVIGRGKRNATLTSLAGTMRQRGMGKEEIDAALQAVNCRRCRPPLAVEEVRGIAASVARYEPGRSDDVPSVAPKHRRRGPPRPLKVAFDRGDHAEMADALLKNLAETHEDLVFDEGLMHRYDDATGLWRSLEPSLLRSMVKSFAGSRKGASGRLKVGLSDAKGAAALAGDVLHAPRFFSDGCEGIAFTNGFLAIDGGVLVLLPHARENRARWGYSFSYDPLLPCPRWEEFLSQCFAGESDATARVELLQEFGGATLMGLAPRYQKALILLGPGGSGKSTAAKVIEGVLPKGTTCAIAPQTLDDEYRLALLAGKLLNVVSELPGVDILCGEAVKAVISGESLTGRPIREAPFTFRPRAGHLFAANRLPLTQDHTSAFFRRFAVLNFPRERDEREYEAGLHEQIIAAEHPAIVAWLARGLARLLTRGHYEIPGTIRQGTDEWRAQTSNVLTFLAESTRPSGPGERGTPGSVLYRQYRSWSLARQQAAAGVQRFSKEMAAAGHPPRHVESGTVYAVELRAEGDISREAEGDGALP